MSFDSKRLMAALLVLGALVSGCSSPKQEPAAASAAQSKAPAEAITNITAADLLKRVEAGEKPLIIDVREQSEWDAGHIEGASLMPLGVVDKKITSVAKDQEVVLICRSGNRSSQAAQILAKMGYTNIKNVVGGMNEWSKVGPVVK